MSTSLDNYWISSVEPIAADAVEQVTLNGCGCQLELNGPEGV